MRSLKFLRNENWKTSQLYSDTNGLTFCLIFISTIIQNINIWMKTYIRFLDSLKTQQKRNWHSDEYRNAKPRRQIWFKIPKSQKPSFIQTG